MDRQWRPCPRPRPIQGNHVCPTCLLSHFPFCPSPPTYYQPFQGDHSFLSRPYAPRNPNWDAQSFRPSYEHANPNGYLAEGDRTFKRPRIDDSAATFTNDYDQNPPMLLSEDERRLKLIRDHGSDGLQQSYARPAFPGIGIELGTTAARNSEMHNLQNGGGYPLHGEERILVSGQQYKLHNQNGFRSDLGHDVSSRGEKDAFPHLQSGEFPPIQYCQVKTSPYPFKSHGTGDLDPQQHISQRVPRPVSEVSGGSYNITAANGPNYSRGDSSLHGMNAPFPEQIGNGDPNKLLPQTYGIQHPVHMRHDFHPSVQSSNVTRLAHEVNFPSQEGNQTQAGQQDMSAVSQRGMSKLNGRVVHYPYPYPTGSSNFSDNMGQVEASRFFRGQPPLPSSPPPPLPLEPHINQSSQLKTYFSPPKKPASLFPVPVSSSVVAPSSYSQIPEAHSLSQQPYFHSKPLPEFSTGFPLEEPSKHYVGDAQPFSLKQLSAEKPKFIDASQLFRHPHRTSRPNHFVIIFRGLPGGGKSYLAKMLRDLEVENGGDAPRIHSMDDYFMTEVEKVEDNEASKSSSSGRNKKPVMKKVMEYCYEPEMEEAYRSSMLKAFKKTVEEGVFTFIIVDDRNLRVADFAQYWATAKRSGYEVYILEATYKDPAGCAARNVHGFTQEDIEKMAGQWEEAPSLYLQLDVKSLFHGDDLKESRIQEVDMDMEDDLGDALPALQGREAENVVDPPVRDDASALKDGKRWDAEGEHPTEVRELGKSKWSEDFGEDDIDQIEGMKGKINALSELIHPYGKERKSVHWGDQVGNTGFSIGAARKVNDLSLVIGPGAGYKLKSNPLPEEGSPTTRNSVEPKKHSIFQERIRAERESFKAVFDRRRQRIGGLDVEED